MKAIIIEEDRFAEIRDKMEFEALKLKESNTPTRLNIDQGAWESAIMEVQRNMNYHFVRWAQSHGAPCVR